jgi:hypothetical protein
MPSAPQEEIGIGPAQHDTPYLRAQSSQGLLLTGCDDAPLVFPLQTRELMLLPYW